MILSPSPSSAARSPQYHKWNLQLPSVRDYQTIPEDKVVGAGNENCFRREKNSFVHSKIGYVRSQVESLARNAPRFQFIRLCHNRTIVKSFCCLPKNVCSLLSCPTKQLPSPMERCSSPKQAQKPSAAALQGGIAFFCLLATTTKRTIIFQLQILHSIKYECIFAWWGSSRTFQAVR